MTGSISAKTALYKLIAVLIVSVVCVFLGNVSYAVEKVYDAAEIIDNTDVETEDVDADIEEMTARPLTNETVAPGAVDKDANAENAGNVADGIDTAALAKVETPGDVPTVSEGELQDALEQVRDAETGVIAITSVEDLKRIGTQGYPLNGEYELKNNIYGDGSVLAPIGNYEAPFSGVFDGKGYTISNITIAINHDDAGFFGVLRGTVKDLFLTDITVSSGKVPDYTVLVVPDQTAWSGADEEETNEESQGSTNEPATPPSAKSVGVLAGRMTQGSRVNGVYISGNIQVTSENDTQRLGGLAGTVESEEVSIEQNMVFVMIEKRGKLTGAFIGRNAATEGCFKSNIWSSAYGQNACFGVNSPVGKADEVFKIETTPAYLSLDARETFAIHANTEQAGSYGLVFTGWNADEDVYTIDSTTNEVINLKAGDKLGAGNLYALYGKDMSDGAKMEVKFATQVIVTGNLTDQIEFVDPYFPTKYADFQKLNQ